jgi:hypothetical protein
MNGNINQQIQTFLEKLLTERGIKVDEDLKRQMISELNQRLQVRFQQIITEELSEQDLANLDKVSESGEAAVQSYLHSKISNLDELLIKAMADFRQAFLAE